MNSSEHAETITFLFTDIEGSTSLWEQEAEQMRLAMASHDALGRSAVDQHGGALVKMTGDGMCATFANPANAIVAALKLQLALADPSTTGGIALRVRCGVHAGVAEHRDGDYFGTPVNRAARIMSAAHGGQIIVSKTVVELVRERVPEGISLRHLGSVRLRGIADPEDVYQVVHAELRHDFPALRALEVTPNNLPQQVTSFVGRERELAEVRKLLETARLVTLLGAGGIGKTRLSLEVASGVSDDYPDGIWFVELAPLADPRLVPQAVASAVGVAEEAGRSVTEALAKLVADRQLLLILDNCEHLLGACIELADLLLRSGPELRILASSRESFRIGAESTYSVPPLAVPDSGHTLALDALTRYEGVRLFIDRAVARHSAFRLNEQNAKAVVEICRHLDGIPLAIELAAARVRALSPESIAQRLDDRFRLLTSGDRTLLPRQQTLRALIDWSYDLLTPAERTLLQRLAVFAGGWTLEAAEVVSAGGEIDQMDVLEILVSLVDKSLVGMGADGGRYGLLETVRRYAEERLSESGDGAATRTRHLDFYMRIAEGVRDGLTGPDQGAWLLRLDLERENLFAASAWCDSAENGGELGLKLVFGVQAYLLRRGFLELGLRTIAEALHRPGAQLRNLARCKALFAGGWQCYYMGRYKDASVYLEESLSIAREIRDQAMVAIVLQPLGMASLGEGNPDRARRHLEEALLLARESGNKRQIAAALNALAQLDRLEGKLDLAEPLYADVLALARELDDRESIAFALLNLAMVSIGRRCAAPARRLLLEALAITHEIGSTPGRQSVLEVSAGLGALDEDWERAALFFGAAEAHAAQTGLHRDPADEAFLAPLVEQTRASFDASAFSAAEASGRALGNDAAIERVRAWLDAPSRAQTA